VALNVRSRFALFCALGGAVMVSAVAGVTDGRRSVAQQAGGPTTAVDSAASFAARCFRDGVFTPPVSGTVVGVNYFDAFYRMLRSGKDFSYQRGLKQLGERDVPFIRFSLTGFWPADLALPLRDPDLFFRRFGAFVEDARRHGVRLLPTVFWNYASLPDYFGESLEAWGNSSSKTRGAMRSFISELMARFGNDPLIVGWEFSNEANTYADLPGNGRFYPIDTSKGTPRTRSGSGEVVSRDLLAGVEVFARLVAAGSPGRLVSAGFDMPRAGAFRLRERRAGLDDESEFVRILKSQNPTPLNVVSIHLYPETVDRFRYRAASMRGLLQAASTVAMREGQVLFVGEFGVSATDETAERLEFGQYLEAVQAVNGGLAALWVFDFSHQDKDWNVTVGGRREYQLNAIVDANRSVVCP
jgi:hypothetical protein